MSQEGIVLNVQRFTYHDGPGIRTELFLKGCPLRCEWCGNPESFKSYVQAGVYHLKCISKSHCGSCEAVCPVANTLLFYDNKISAINRETCINCMACQDACPADAIKRFGNLMTVEACMKEIRKDRGYYERSGGGVTISGGEPLLQSEFVLALFKACQAEGIHTCLESSFFGDWKEIKKLVPYTDLFISDLKHLDTNVHKQYTGVKNDKILENLKELSELNHELILRIPVIPNVNDDMKNIEATADFILNELKGRVRTLQLLSFMHLGEEKYCSLGIPYKMKEVNINREAFQEQVEKIAKYFNDRGIHCTIGAK